jgi:glycosyltransferase involved in cell wall biosynthesis
LRILYLVFYYFPRASAATWSTFALTKRLSQIHDIDLLIPNVEYKTQLNMQESEKAQIGSRVNVHRTPWFKIPEGLAPILAPIFMFLEGVKLAKSCNVIVCQFQPHHFVFLTGIALSRVFRKPVVARANDVYREMGEKLSLIQRMNQIRRHMYSNINETFIREADAFLVVCKENRDLIISRTGSFENIGISHNGVDGEEFHLLDKNANRAMLRIPLKENVILFIGRFSGAEYRLDILLEAYALVREVLPNSCLYLVGDKLPKKLEERANQLGVKIFGHVPREKIKSFIAAADVCIGPLGNTQAIPLKVLEYMAAGRPIVTGVGSVSRELALNGINCLIAEMTSRSVADNIIKLLTDEDLQRRLIKNASTTVKLFYWNNIASEFEDKILEISKRGPTSTRLT